MSWLQQGKQRWAWRQDGDANGGVCKNGGGDVTSLGKSDSIPKEKRTEVLGGVERSVVHAAAMTKGPECKAPPCSFLSITPKYSLEPERWKRFHRKSKGGELRIVHVVSQSVSAVRKIQRQTGLEAQQQASQPSQWLEIWLWPGSAKEVGECKESEVPGAGMGKNGQAGWHCSLKGP